MKMTGCDQISNQLALSLCRRLLHCRSRRVKHVPWDIPLVPLYLPRLRRVSFRFRIGTWIVRTLKRVYVVVVPLRHVVSHERPSEIQYGSIIDPLLRRYSFGNTKGGLLPFDLFHVLQKSRTIEQRSLYLTRRLRVLRNRQQRLKLVYFYNKMVNRTHSRTWSVGVQRYESYTDTYTGIWTGHLHGSYSILCGQWGLKSFKG